MSSPDPIAELGCEDGRWVLTIHTAKPERAQGHWFSTVRVTLGLFVRATKRTVIVRLGLTGEWMDVRVPEPGRTRDVSYRRGGEPQLGNFFLKMRFRDPNSQAVMAVRQLCLSPQFGAALQNWFLNRQERIADEELTWVEVADGSS